MSCIFYNYVSVFLQIIQPALNVLVNLVCPAPSISNKPPLQSSQSQAPLSNGPSIERNVSDRAGESAVVDRGSTATPCTQSNSNSGLVGIRLGAGYAGLAAQLEQGYRQAREAVRTNSGIRVLLHLLQPRIYSPAAALDCLRALACRVLLGLARDDAIAHILTKLQVSRFFLRFDFFCSLPLFMLFASMNLFAFKLLFQCFFFLLQSAT